MTAISDQSQSVIAAETRLLDQRQAEFLKVVRINALTSALVAFAVIVLGGLMLCRAYRRVEGSRASLRRSEEQFRLLHPVLACSRGTRSLRLPGIMSSSQKNSMFGLT